MREAVVCSQLLAHFFHWRGKIGISPASWLQVVAACQLEVIQEPNAPPMKRSSLAQDVPQWPPLTRRDSAQPVQPVCAFGKPTKPTPASAQHVMVSLP
jgi:hypothetical protein